MRFAAFVLGLMLLAGPVAAQPATTVRLQDSFDLFVLPAMQRFQREAAAMPVAMAGLCETPGEAALATARDAFGAVVRSHAAIEWIRIGPIMDDNRADRLLFWPDRRGIGLKQVQAVLAAGDPLAADAATLRDKSVAVQGLGALEFVLFGTGAETLLSEEGDFRCRYGVAIGENLKALAWDVADGWRGPGGMAARMSHPQADYPDYRTKVEALEGLVGVVSHGLEGIKDTRLLPFIATADREARPKQALFWRSGLTMAALRANIEGMHNLLTGLHLDNQGDVGLAGLANSIDFEYGNAHRALDLVTDAPEAAVTDPEQAKALSYLAIVLDSLQAMVGEQLSPALGLSVGFSSLDGD